MAVATLVPPFRAIADSAWRGSYQMCRRMPGQVAAAESDFEGSVQAREGVDAVIAELEGLRS